MHIIFIDASYVSLSITVNLRGDFSIYNGVRGKGVEGLRHAERLVGQRATVIC